VALWIIWAGVRAAHPERDPLNGTSQDEAGAGVTAAV
jgi:hypothetical protein